MWKKDRQKNLADICSKQASDQIGRQNQDREVGQLLFCLLFLTPLGIPRSLETPDLRSPKSGLSLPYHSCLCLLETDIELPVS